MKLRPAFCLLFCAALVFAHSSAPAQQPRSGRFQKMPRDPSLHEDAPQTTGALDFVGNITYTAAQLKEPMAEQIKEIDKEGLTRPRADDAAFYLGVYYRKQGFAQAEVKWEIRGTRLLLTIAEGPRTYLRHITFVGNKSVNKVILFEYLVGGTEERLSKDPKAVPFVEGDIQGGVARIRGLYESEGRLEVKVEDAILAYSGNGFVDVTVQIAEGPRFTFGEVKFLGETAFGRDQLIDALGEPLVNPFTTQRLNTMEHNLLYYYKLHGYYAATVQAAGDAKLSVPGKLNNRRVPVSFTIKAGPVYHFDGMTVTGLDRLRLSFFQHRFSNLTGQVYTPPLLDEKFRELLRTGLFKNLRVNTVALPSHEVRADFTVEEAKAKEIGFSIGFSSYEGATIGLRLADRDLFGNGRPLSLQIETSQRGLLAELLYTDPWFYDSPYALRARLFSQSRTEIGYDKVETGLRTDLTRKLTTNIELGLFLQVKTVEVTSEIIPEEFLGPTSYQVASLGFTQSFDFREPRGGGPARDVPAVNPTRGWIITSAVDGGYIGGDLAYGRAAARATYFLPLPRQFLLALGARGGVIYPLTAVPIDERFFNGGATTVRSFRERELGPRDPKGGNPIGGEAFTVFNTELTFPLKDALRGAVFVDAGNLTSAVADAGFDDLRFAVGIGIRYALPIGPVRLDVAVNPAPKAEEDWGAVHFSFGFAF